MLKKEKIKELEEKIGYEFKKKELIWQALTHSSFSNEQKINKKVTCMSNNYKKLIKYCLCIVKSVIIIKVIV